MELTEHQPPQRSPRPSGSALGQSALPSSALAPRAAPRLRATPSRHALAPRPRAALRQVGPAGPQPPLEAMELTEHPPPHRSPRPSGSALGQSALPSSALAPRAAPSRRALAPRAARRALAPRAARRALAPRPRAAPSRHATRHATRRAAPRHATRHAPRHAPRRATPRHAPRRATRRAPAGRVGWSPAAA
jgi:hypothetical protein